MGSLIILQFLSCILLPTLLQCIPQEEEWQVKSGCHCLDDSILQALNASANLTEAFNKSASLTEALNDSANLTVLGTANISNATVSLSEALNYSANLTVLGTANISNATISLTEALNYSANLTVLGIANISNATDSEETAAAEEICQCEANKTQETFTTSTTTTVTTLNFTTPSQALNLDLLFVEEYNDSNTSDNESIGSMPVSEENYNDSNLSYVQAFEIMTNMSNVSRNESTTLSISSTSTTSITVSVDENQVVCFVYGELALQLEMSEGNAVDFQALLLEASFRLAVQRSIAHGLADVVVPGAVEILEVAPRRRLQGGATGNDGAVEMRIGFRIRVTSPTGDAGPINVAMLARDLEDARFATRLLQALEAEPFFLEAFASQGAFVSLLGVSVENVEVVMPAQSLATTVTSTTTARVQVTSTTTSSLWVEYTSIGPGIVRDEPDISDSNDDAKTWSAVEIVPLALTLLAGLLLPCSVSSVIEEATSPSRLLSPCCARRVRWLQASTGLPCASRDANGHLEPPNQQCSDGGYLPILGQPTSRFSGALMRWRGKVCVAETQLGRKVEMSTSQGSASTGEQVTTVRTSSVVWNICQHGPQLLIEIACGGGQGLGASAPAVLLPTAWNEWRSSVGRVHVRYVTPTRLRVIRYDRKNRGQTHGDGPAIMHQQSLPGAVPTRTMPALCGLSAGPADTQLTQGQAEAAASPSMQGQVAEHQCHRRPRGPPKPKLDGTLKAIAEAASSDLLLALDLSPLTQHLLSALGILELLAAGGALAVSVVARLGTTGLLVSGVLCVLGLLTFLLSLCRSAQKLALCSSAARRVLAAFPALCLASALFVSAVFNEPRRAVLQINDEVVDFGAGAAGVISAMLAVAFLLFESDCLSFFFVCMLDLVVGMAVCGMLAVGGWSGDQDDTFNFPALLDYESWSPLEAGRLAALLLLFVLTMGRLALAFALHPYMQPLRPPSTSVKADVLGVAADDLRVVLSPTPAARPALKALPAFFPAAESASLLTTPAAPLASHSTITPAPNGEPAGWPPALPAAQAARPRQGFRFVDRRIPSREPAAITNIPAAEMVHADTHGFYSLARGEHALGLAGESTAASSSAFPHKERLGWPDAHLLTASPAPGGRFIRWNWHGNLSGSNQMVPQDTCTAEIFPGASALRSSDPCSVAGAPSLPPPLAAPPLSPSLTSTVREHSQISEGRFGCEDARDARTKAEKARLQVEEEEMRLKARAKAKSEAEEHERLQVGSKIEEGARLVAQEAAQFELEEEEWLKAHQELQLHIEADASLSAEQRARLNMDHEARSTDQEETQLRRTQEELDSVEEWPDKQKETTPVMDQEAAPDKVMKEARAKKSASPIVSGKDDERGSPRQGDGASLRASFSPTIEEVRIYEESEETTLLKAEGEPKLNEVEEAPPKFQEEAAESEFLLNTTGETDLRADDKASPGADGTGNAALEIDIFSEAGEQEGVSVMDSPWGVSDRQLTTDFQQPVRFALSPSGSSTSGPLSGREVLGSFAGASSRPSISSPLAEVSEVDSDAGVSDDQVARAMATQRSTQRLTQRSTYQNQVSTSMAPQQDSADLDVTHV